MHSDKTMPWFRKKCHLSNTIICVGIQKVELSINNFFISIRGRICKVHTSVCNICVELLSQHMGTGAVVPASIIDRVVKIGCSLCWQLLQMIYTCLMRMMKMAKVIHYGIIYCMQIQPSSDEPV